MQVQYRERPARLHALRERRGTDIANQVALRELKGTDIADLAVCTRRRSEHVSTAPRASSVQRPRPHSLPRPRIVSAPLAFTTSASAAVPTSPIWLPAPAAAACA